MRRFRCALSALRVRVVAWTWLLLLVLLATLASVAF